MDLSNRLVETHSSETDVSAKGEEVFISSLQREKKTKNYQTVQTHSRAIFSETVASDCNVYCSDIDG